MNNISRRDALRGAIAAGAGVLVLNGLGESQTQAASGLQTDASPLAFAGKHQPKPLPFDPAKLTGISEKLIKSHHDNNYVGAVTALNLVEGRLAAMAKDKDAPHVYAATSSGRS